MTSKTIERCRSMRFRHLYPTVIENLVELLGRRDEDYPDRYQHLQRLSEGMLWELVALMWLGRTVEGEDCESYPRLLAQTRRCDFDPRTYLAGKTPLAEYLRRGWQRLLTQTHADELEAPVFTQDFSVV